MYIDTRSLISEVQKRPHLWDPSTREYRLRDARMASWIEVCGKLIKNFNDMDIKTQDKIVLKIRTRWKTARDTFMKINNKLKGRTKKASKYYYFEQLQFLGQVQPRKRPQFITKREKALQIKQEVRQETPVIKEEHLPVVKIEDDSNDGVLASKEVTVPSNNKNCTDNINEEEEKADCAFLWSLLPALRKFDDNQKLKFRVDVLQIIRRVKNSQNPSTSIPSSFP